MRDSTQTSANNQITTNVLKVVLWQISRDKSISTDWSRDFIAAIMEMHLDACGVPCGEGKPPAGLFLGPRESGIFNSWRGPRL